MHETETRSAPPHAGAADRRVRDFADGRASMVDLLGGKGASPAEMARLGLPAPGRRELPAAVLRWHEQNPMLGLRGVRLGLVVPGIYAMQVRAPAEAMVARRGDGGAPVTRLEAGRAAVLAGRAAPGNDTR
jgi:hypothetical protein